MAKSLDKDSGAHPGPPPLPERRVGARTNIVFPVLCRYESVLDFVETQSMNISHTGMFIATETPAPPGSIVEFDFSLADGFSLLKGAAQVMRVVTDGPVNGMGVRFTSLDDANRRLVGRIVAVNLEEGRSSTLNFDFSRPATAGSMPLAPAGDVVTNEGSRQIHFDARSLRVVLGPLTVHHFTQNPLLNVRSGGFFIPADEQVPLGTIFDVVIVDVNGQSIVTGKGKVVAKQDLRVGIRLDADKEGLARLRGEVAKLAPTK